jgi:hypothetical protein
MIMKGPAIDLGPWPLPMHSLVMILTGRYMHFAGRGDSSGNGDFIGQVWGESDKKEAIMRETSQPPARPAVAS